MVAMRRSALWRAYGAHAMAALFAVSVVAALVAIARA
jgi:hypothetical protein